MATDTLVPTKAATARLGISRPTLDRLVARGEIKRIKIGTGSRYSVADLEAFIERNTVQPTAGR